MKLACPPDYDFKKSWSPCGAPGCKRAQGQTSQPAAFPHDTWPLDGLQHHDRLVGDPPRLPFEVVDQVATVCVVAEDVVVVDGLLEQAAGGNERVDCCRRGVGLSEDRPAIDFAEKPAASLDSRIRPDHLQVKNRTSWPDRCNHVAQDVHDVLGLHSSE